MGIALSKLSGGATPSITCDVGNCTAPAVYRTKRLGYRCCDGHCDPTSADVEPMVERQAIPVLQVAETYAVVGPKATSLHAGFVDVERAFECAARLTEHTKRQHTVRAVLTAPQRKQRIPVLALEVVA